ncbi:MAG: glutathione binding-like protein, partial [Pseudomonadales bacterium]
GQLLPDEGSLAYWRVLEWLMWQMGGVGPMLGQAHHFLRYNKGISEYAEERYLNETLRLYSVLDKRLSVGEYLADDYSIADIATWPWVSRYEWHQVELGRFPNVKRWYQSIAERAAVQRGYHIPHRVNDVPMPG